MMKLDYKNTLTTDKEMTLVLNTVLSFLVIYRGVFLRKWVPIWVSDRDIARA